MTVCLNGNQVLIKPSECLLQTLQDLGLREVHTIPEEILKKLEYFLKNDKQDGLLPFDLIKKLYFHIYKTSKSQFGQEVYLHEWLEGSTVHHPKLVVPPRNPELEIRIQKLKAEQEHRDYNRMTHNVSLTSEPGSKPSVAEEVKQLRSQIFAVANFVLSVAGTFAFGYKVVEYSTSTPIVSLQVLVGMVFATIVAIAELYFLLKVI